MKRTLIITGHEYRRMTRLAGFWVMTLLVPLVVLVAPVVQSLLGRSQTTGYVLVDKSSRYASAISQRVELDYQRQVLVQLLSYAGEWLAPRAAGAPASAPDVVQSAVSSDRAVQAFVTLGGAQWMLEKLKPRILPNAPPFQPPPRPYLALPIPAGVDVSDPDKFAASISPHFQQTSRSLAGQAGLGVAVFIPQNVDAGGLVRVWVNGQSSAALIQDIRLEVTRGLQQDALGAAKVDPLTAAQIQGVVAPVAVQLAESTSPGGRGTGSSALPLVMAYLLLISMIVTGVMMLQGMVEERSNKLLEAVLACVSPRELMVGKLLGISAIGLTIVAVWTAAAVGIVYADPSHPLGFLLPAFAAIAKTPWTIVAMIFYFLAGYLTVGMIYLTVGAISDSMQEAQTFLLPLTLIIIAPSIALARLIYSDPNGLIPQIASWVPLYTPVTMLARLQSGVRPIEIVGTAVVLIGFATLELVVLGQVFQHSLFRTGSGLQLRFPTSALRLPTGARRRRLWPLAIVAVIILAIIGARIHKAMNPGRAQAPPPAAQGMTRLP